MFAFQRYIRSPCVKLLGFNSICRVRRYLTTAQTTEALRPFIFAVHPDFFGQYPKERAANEKSLKLLFSYIDGLHQDQRTSATELTFYLRNQTPLNGQPVNKGVIFRSVKIGLSSLDIYTTVNGILASCDLSTAVIEQYKQENAEKEGEFPRPVEWHQSYYAYTGKKNPKDNVQRKQGRPEITLSYWLKKNIAEARKKLERSRPTKEEIVSLRRYLIGQLGLEDIVWESMWDSSMFCSCLKTMKDVCQQHWAIMQNLRGCTVVLGDLTRLTPSGRVVLSSQDVPHHWVSFISGLPKQREILPFIPPTEQALSTLLGGCSVKALEGPASTMTANSHYAALVMLIETMEKHKFVKRKGEKEEECLVLPEGITQGINIIIEGSTGEQYIDHNGDVHLMCNKSAPNIIRYLLSNAKNARELCNNHMSDVKEEALLISRCLEELELATLTRHLDVTPSQMIACCRKLEENPVRLGVVVRNLHVQIRHHYALRRDGDVCIPWNWKE
ncbi:T-cell activation inhibitor, mitochondrial [Strongylocentrotus purpuratus]|uniref:T-cell activation inhibitor, mitochondrial n=1 Tax=Strongylocentrotus purpuratus TaxID=7668 RepID=A0A7M7RAT8_STRPU|nr:T-cell activation inhibitor, mitochondrial [Strongylocentrotus purpuratus]|eukprot:XP_784547.3 PREDICTED: T-cell activation inhibitor, mitochondrial [Strongylocentrotus purpuratus]